MTIALEEEQVLSPPAITQQETSEKELKVILDTIDKMHPVKISRVKSLCCNGISNEDIQRVTKISLPVIEAILQEVIPDNYWCVIKGEDTNSLEVTYSLLRTSEITDSIITETSVADQVYTGLHGTLSYINERVRTHDFKNLTEALTVVRTISTLVPTLSKMGRMEGLSEVSSNEPPSKTLVLNAVTQYNSMNFSNPTHPIVNKDQQVIGLKTVEGDRALESMSRRNIDELAIETYPEQADTVVAQSNEVNIPQFDHTHKFNSSDLSDLSDSPSATRPTMIDLANKILLSEDRDEDGNQP